mmetsp:Transcript_41276/g.54254  ORF Transcript_41276/g.54254 Transcript_41276/m.54254 type:complete len:104 (-) Transcript_41276:213-524(-)
MHAVSESELLILGGRDHTYSDLMVDGMRSKENNLPKFKKITHSRIGKYRMIKPRIKGKKGKKGAKSAAAGPAVEEYLPEMDSEGEERCLFKEKPGFAFADFFS